MPFAEDRRELLLRFFYLLEDLDEILDALQDIRLVLELEEELSILLRPDLSVFDPLRTIGKYTR
jgi:hypothetical protein